MSDTAPTSAKEFAKHFAEHFADYLRAAQMVANIEDAEFSRQEAEMRLAKRQAELSAANDKISDARAQATKAVEAANRQAEEILAKARGSADSIISGAHVSARTLITNATGEGERKLAIIEREIASTTTTRDQLASGISDLTRQRQILLKEVEETSAALAGLRAEMAAIKARF